MRLLTAVLALVVSGGAAVAGDAASSADAVAAQMFKAATGEWADRVKQDATQEACSRSLNKPSADLAGELTAREKASVKFPDDGSVLGDWKKGEVLAQTGTGGQFTDKPDAPRGGNCYACHQMAAGEVSYGTLGPSLKGYGKTKGQAPEALRDAYAKIYNSNAFLACSSMPRFGVHGFLTMEQIKDLTAYLMAPESPVNR